MRPEPYRFAARAALAVAVMTAVVLAADRAVAAAFARGVRLVPPLPPGEQLPPRELFEVAAGRGSVVVLGDSVVTHVPRREADPASLFALIAREVPAGLAAVDESRGGRGVEMMSAQLEAMRRFDLLPRAAVLVVNLREFSPACELNPYLQQSAKARMLATGTFLPVRAGEVFKWRFGVPTGDEFLSLAVHVGGVRVGTVRELERPRAYFPSDDGAPGDLGLTRARVRYAFDIGRSVRLHPFTAAIDGLRARDVPVVAVLAPIDVEYLRARLSPTEMDAVRANAKALRRAIARPGVEWLDLSQALGSGSFDHPPLYPDEHLRADGRHRVASLVGERLRAALAH